MLAQDGRLSQDDIWTRIRGALEAGQVGNATRAALYLPAGQQPEPRTLTLISSNPAGYLEKQQFDLRTRAGRETVMFAVYRLARTSPQQAAAHWARHEKRFSAEERAYVWGQIAQFGAMRHEPEALAWFAKARDLSDLQLGWKARAALAPTQLDRSAGRDRRHDRQGARAVGVALLEGARAESGGPRPKRPWRC